MKKNLILFLAIMLSGFAVFAQKHTEIQLKAKSSEFKVNDRHDNGFSIQSNISKLILNQLETKSGQFQQLTVEGLVKTFNAGSPELPVYSKLIEIPQNAKVAVEVVSYEEEIINLVDYGINQQIIPAQHSMSKSDDPAKVPFIFDGDMYKTNRFINENTILFEESGMMRATRLGRIEISPIQYNPVTNQIRILNNLVINVRFEGANMTKTNELKAKYYSPAFSTAANTINSLPMPKELITNQPVTLVIVSDPMFQAQLQEFIAWKKLKGFHVIEAYTNNPSVGITNATIKAYLAGLYNTPPQGVNAPSYVLFVGDVQQIPAWNSSGKNNDGTKANYITDLRYCEYTNDDIPEVYYGRFSAQNTTQLQPQIDKTLMYEKYTMSDPSYLEKSMLVAGVDGTYAPTYGNGAINYATTYYVNASHDVDPLTYLYNNAASSTVMASNNSGASASIRSYMSEGLAFANYTAHCGSDGWSDPSYTSTHVNSLTNSEKYGLWIGNCCQSLMFGYDACFGEAGLRKANGGAIGIIGGSESTYWSEDYWWGIGLTSSITVNPTYEASGLGVYDAINHEGANEVNNTSRWYIAQGQLNMVGNLAVQSSTSTRKRYYWEIYHLMGDPTLIPYLRIPDANTPVCSPSILMLGMTELSVTTAPYATVALSQNGVLIDVKVANNSGEASLTFQNTAITVGNCNLVITGQNLQPYIGTIEVVPASEPYVVVHNFTISDVAGNNNNQPDFGESITLNLDLKNVATTGSGYNANNVTAVLSTTDSYITITDNSQTFGNINAGSVVSQANAFALTIANNIPDQHNFIFSLAITGSDNTKQNYTWNGNISFLGNAPVLTFEEMMIDDEFGNNDGMLDPNETALLKIKITNNGHADVNNVVSNINLTSGSEYLTINTPNYNVGALNAGQSIFAPFTVTSNENTPLGTTVDVAAGVSGGSNQQYTASKNYGVVIGFVPEYCTPSITNACGSSNEYISRVVFGTIDNASACTSGGYIDYSNLSIQTLTNQTIPITVSIGNFYSTDKVTCWVDWNYNGTFGDVDNEIFVLTVSSSKANGSATGNIVVPAGIVLRDYILRIRLTYGGTPEPCGSVGYGETEDYTISVFDPNSFSVIIQVKNAQDSVAISGANVSLESYGVKTTNLNGSVVFHNVQSATNVGLGIDASLFEVYNSVMDITENLTKVVYLTPIPNAINNQSKNEVMVYPNPSNGKINIQLPENTNDAKINIYTIHGQLIYSGLIAKQSSEINLGNAKGIYMLEVISEKINARQQIIVE